jgi:formate hydrogenlyase subunit 3/multisubunit Na+/H+ antiporter MnhD subunit
VLLLVVLGFGIKIALPGLHLWMPATYASLPIAAAAVVSGPMISAGMLGLIRFLTPASGEHELVGQVLLVAGSLSACYAVIIGLMQSQVRVTLAYSSMSKMGLLAAALGIALIYPAQSPALIAAIVMFTLHHLLIKSALFFGLGFAEQSTNRAGLLAGFVLLIISLAGVPFTSGALTKAQLGAALPNELNQFVIALSVATFISVLLIARVFYLIAKSKTAPPAAPVATIGLWWLLIMVIMFWPWLFEQPLAKWSDMAVLLTASGIAAGVWRFKPPWLTRTIGLIPAGDMLHVISAVSKRLGHWLLHVSALMQKHRLVAFKQHAVHWLTRLNTGLLQIAQLTMAWRSAGLIWLVMGIIIFIAMFIGAGAINIGVRP